MTEPGDDLSLFRPIASLDSDNTLVGKGNHHLLDPVLGRLTIAVDEQQNVSLRLFRTIVASGGRPALFLGDQHQVPVGVVRGPLFGNLWGFVLGTVVDNQNLDGADLLLGKTFQKTSQVRFIVVDRNDDAGGKGVVRGGRSNQSILLNPFVESSMGNGATFSCHSPKSVKCFWIAGLGFATRARVIILQPLCRTSEGIPSSDRVLEKSPGLG